MKANTLPDAILDEIKRVRECVEVYRTIPTGAFAMAVLLNTVAYAEKAIAEGDAAACVIIR